MIQGRSDNLTGLFYGTIARIIIPADSAQTVFFIIFASYGYKDKRDSDRMGGGVQ